LEKLREALVYAVILIGTFAAGLAWKPLYESVANAKDYLESLSFIATIIACAIAANALTAWKKQFNHAERFKALKELKDAAIGLTAFRGFFEKLCQRCLYLQTHGNVQVFEMEEELDIAKENWHRLLTDYNKAWGTARAFLTERELVSIRGGAPTYVKLSLDLPLRIVNAYANSPGPEGQLQFLDLIEKERAFLKKLYSDTVATLEWMLMHSS
jgi:hypothetical protein